MDKNKIGHIYILLFPNGKRYVGQTIRTIRKRIWEHKHLSNDGYASVVYNATRKYGENSVKIERVLTIKCTQEYLNLLEDRCIIMFNTLAPNGYNLKRGGSHGALSEEAKAKIALAKAKRAPPSVETKSKISAALRGHLCSEETRAKISAAKKGKSFPQKRVIRVGWHHSREARIKISVALKGKPSPTKGKPAWNKGKPWSIETRAKISAARKGKPRSIETRAKISAANKKRARRPHTEEEKAKMRGRHPTEEARKKMSISRKKYLREKWLVNQHDQPSGASIS
jgi:group I intron endonuclease